MTRTSSKLLRALLLALVPAMAVPARVARAQERSASDIAQAREIFSQAIAERDAGDAAGALEKLKAAHALAETPITGLELGRTYAALGKLIEARETLLSIARLARKAAETSRSVAARKQSAELAEQIRPRIPSLTVKVTGVAMDSVAVTIDGALVPSAALVAPRLVNPGSHKVAATSTSGGAAETTVDLKEGEASDVELKIVLTQATPAPIASEPPPSAPPSVAPPSSGPGPLVFVGFGAAAAGIALGSVTGLMSMSKASSVKNACDRLTCPRSIDGDLQSGRTLGTVSTIAFIVAGAGAVAGVVGLVLRPHQESAPSGAAVTPWIGPGAAGVTGSF